MKTPAFAQLLLLVAFLLLPLLSVVMQWVMRRRLEEHTPERESVTPMPRRAPPTPTPVPTLRASPRRVGASPAPIVSTPLPQRQCTRRSIVGNRRDMRRGIMMMTILGPCRALEGLESRRPESVLETVPRRPVGAEEGTICRSSVV
jgi:hypothetical protein